MALQMGKWGYSPTYYRVINLAGAQLVRRLRNVTDNTHRIRGTGIYTVYTPAFVPLKFNKTNVSKHILPDMDPMECTCKRAMSPVPNQWSSPIHPREVSIATLLTINIDVMGFVSPFCGCFLVKKNHWTDGRHPPAIFVEAALLSHYCCWKESCTSWYGEYHFFHRVS